MQRGYCSPLGAAPCLQQEADGQRAGCWAWFHHQEVTPRCCLQWFLGLVQQRQPRQCRQPRSCCTGAGGCLWGLHPAVCPWCPLGHFHVPRPVGCLHRVSPTEPAQLGGILGFPRVQRTTAQWGRDMGPFPPHGSFQLWGWTLCRMWVKSE